MACLGRDVLHESGNNREGAAFNVRGGHLPRTIAAYELVTVVLNDLGSERTEMLFEQRGHMRPEEYDRAKDGWGGFFDRMEARLRA